MAIVSIHKPVLLKETIAVLDPKPGEFFIDGTFGGGGHSAAILEELGANGRLLAVDWDENAVKKFMIHDSRIILEIGNFADLPAILQEKHLGQADGLLLDLGMSSDQLENSGRGFSFQQDEPLLMTYDLNAKPVKDILRELSEMELAEIIRKFGEERFAKRIAKAIKERERVRPLATSKELADLIVSVVPKNYERGRIHPATRTFLALRIYANHELENLERILQNLTHILKPASSGGKPGGRAAIISFHSLEDRLVKKYFRELAKVGRAKILTKKPITPSAEEIAANPKARSAKLRALVII